MHVHFVTIRISPCTPNVIPQATPLHYAAKQKGNLDVVKFLVEKGANVDCKDSYDVSHALSVIPE